MKSASLQRRLLLFALAGILLALALTGLLLSALFERHLTRRVTAELDGLISRISGNLSLSGETGLSLPDELADPRFGTVFGGYYWQVIDETAGASLRSRSLWDEGLAMPADAPPLGEFHTHKIGGPNRASLLVRERRVVISAAGAATVARIGVAVDQKEIRSLRADFTQDMILALALLGACLFGGSWLQVRLGLGPLDLLRVGVAAIRADFATRMPAGLPAEVQPLVDEINVLIAAKRKETEQARNRAADLAHGLKTPLTILGSEVRKLRARGDTKIAADIDSVAILMRRQVERQFALARRNSATTPLTELPVLPAVERLAATLARLPGAGKIAFRLDIPGRTATTMNADDFNDVIGNLLENAARHARSRVEVRIVLGGSGDCLFIADDGPGVPDEKISAILVRGIRLDEKRGGTGLGLAIAGDILEAYGARLETRRAALGGLEIGFRLPGRAHSGTEQARGN